MQTRALAKEVNGLDDFMIGCYYVVWDIAATYRAAMVRAATRYAMRAANGYLDGLKKHYFN